MISSYTYCVLGLALSAEIGALIYLECSAIKSEGLDEVKFDKDDDNFENEHLGFY